MKATVVGKAATPFKKPSPAAAAAAANSSVVVVVVEVEGDLITQLFVVCFLAAALGRPVCQCPDSFHATTESFEGFSFGTMYATLHIENKKSSLTHTYVTLPHTYLVRQRCFDLYTNHPGVAWTRHHRQNLNS